MIISKEVRDCKVEVTVRLLDDVFEDKESCNCPCCLTPNSRTFNDYTWEEIHRIAYSGRAKEYFRVGDEKIITLKNGEELTIAICGFNHDFAAGKKKIVLPITFTTKNLLETSYCLDSKTYKNGYKDCEFRNKTIKEIFELLPDDLQRYIATTDKGETQDKLFLFNEIEVFGKTEYSGDKFGNHYEYYKDKQHRNKYKNSEEFSRWWWLRSPFSDGCSLACCVGGNGGPGGNGVINTCGVSFGFCF